MDSFVRASIAFQAEAPGVQYPDRALQVQQMKENGV